MNELQEEIKQLKKMKHAVILAHYYVPDEVQEIADYIGDSFYLSRKVRDTEADVLVFAGVSFMGESAKILNPEKKVLLPDPEADCAMAHMADVETIHRMRKKYPDLAVVCYINSTAELKAEADVCVTSSNAVDIVKKLPNQTIFFIPDKNLASYVASQVPEKHMIYNDGFCPVHKAITPLDVKKAKEAHPDALLLVHPECEKEVLHEADFVGSTSELITFAQKADQKEFLIGTEDGVLYELRQKNPEKRFYVIHSRQCCVDMKKVTLEKVYTCLKDEINEVHVNEETGKRAKRALNRMLEMAK
ncbi:MAG: quinolinate synthase NadA [Lachnospiraceae bacterium]